MYGAVMHTRFKTEEFKNIVNVFMLKLYFFEQIIKLTLLLIPANQCDNDPQSCAHGKQWILIQQHPSKFDWY